MTTTAAPVVATDACHVALLPAGAPAFIDLPGDGPGSTQPDWSAWRAARPDAAPGTPVDADPAAWLAAAAALVWRWSGRTAFALHVRAPGRDAWMLAAVRLAPAATWQDLRDACAQALSGGASWDEPLPPAARIGFEIGPVQGAGGDDPLAVPDTLDVHWQSSAPAGIARARQRGGMLSGAALDILSDDWVRTAVAAPPACALDALPLLRLDCEEARRTVGPRAERPRPGGATLAARLARLAAHSPDSVAVEHGGERLTYGALHAAAHLLAHRIVALAGPYEEAVGIMCVPGPRMLVALYGALLANKYYVPLDPNYPAARLAAMVEDADPALIVADAPAGGRARVGADGRPGGGPDAPAAGAGALPAGAPEGLAYVLYTSGSSGVPKGVAQSHANVLFHAETYAASIDLTAADRVALVASLCFDASVMDIFGALAAGAAVYPYQPARTEPAVLLAALDRDGVTIFHATPTLFRLLFGLPGAAAPAQVRAVVLGGELVTPSDVALFRRVFGAHVRLVNGYGPSESTMALQYALESPALLPAGAVPVGHPLPGVRATVGAPGAPWRAFEEGELFLHSDHLFCGYLNRADETAARMVSDAGGRNWYRTGDLALRLPDGRLVVRGRVDQQVKLNGFRIEPGDVEACLLAFPGVRQAAVRPGRLHGRDVLLAYVGAPAPGPDAAMLREHLHARLPAHMRPARIVRMDALPLTPSGKLDRLALPTTVPDDGDARAAVERIDGTHDGGDTIAMRLAALWRQVLGHSPASDADFFRAGGHSLAALQLAGRIRQAFGVEFPLPCVFATPVLAEMAAAIGRLLQAAPAADGADIAPPRAGAGRSGAGHTPLAPVQNGLWYLHQTGDAAARAYNMQLALRLHGEVDERAFEAALDGLAARHATLRTGFALADDKPVQIVAPALPMRLRHCDAPVAIGAATDAEGADAFVLDVAQVEAAQPFDLAAPPLMRVVRGRLGPGEHYVVVTLHHLIADGWSLALLLREFGQLYGAALHGQAPPAPPGLDYAAHAERQCQMLDDAARARSGAFWRSYFDGAAPLLRWKAADPAVAPHAGGNHTFPIAPDLKDALVRIGTARRATPFMVLLAIWCLKLAAESGCSDVVVGTAAANRSTPETERLIGLFVNPLPLRVAVTPALSFDAYLDCVRDACLAAFAHQALPFDEVVRVLGRAGMRGANPVFQVMLTFDAFGLDDAAPPPGLGVRVLERRQQTSHLDLALSVRPQGEGWVATLTYAAALFTPAEGARLADDMLALMRAVAAQPDAPCADFDCGKPFAEDFEW